VKNGKTTKPNDSPAEKGQNGKGEKRSACKPHGEEPGPGQVWTKDTSNFPLQPQKWSRSKKKVDDAGPCSRRTRPNKLESFHEAEIRKGGKISSHSHKVGGLLGKVDNTSGGLKRRLKITKLEGGKKLPTRTREPQRKNTGIIRSAQ